MLVRPPDGPSLSSSSLRFASISDTVLSPTMHPRGVLFVLLLALVLLPISLSVRPFILVIHNEDLVDGSASADAESVEDSAPDWEEFGEPDAISEDDLDPGSWRPIFEPSSSSSALNSSSDSLYFSGVRSLISASSSGDTAAMDEAISVIETAAFAGSPHAQSALGFVFSTGCMRAKNRAKAHLYHYFAAQAGNMQSKMVLAYTYFRQDVSMP